MKILIFGGTKFIGKELVSILSQNSTYILHISSHSNNHIISNNIKYHNIDRNDSKKIYQLMLMINPAAIIDFLCFNDSNVKPIISFSKYSANLQHYIMISSFYVYLNTIKRERK